MIDIIKWLESADGECWSRRMHNTDGIRSFLMSVKIDTAGADFPFPDFEFEAVLWHA
jgi:hypothetical protein